MGSVTIKIEGMEALQRALRQAPDVVRARAADAIQASSFAVAQRARGKVPVDTGKLKAAIGSLARGLNGRVGITDTDMARGPARYWRFVEFGTVRTPAQPFFRPAADEEATPYVNRLRAIGVQLERDFSAGRFL